MNLKEDLELIVSQVSEIEKNKEEEKKIITDKLFKLKKMLEKSIINYESKISKKRMNLKEVNECLCKLMGHDWTSWEEHPSLYLDRDWYYTRKCNICGKREEQHDMPLEYIVIDNKTGKVYQKKRK